MLNAIHKVAYIVKITGNTCNLDGALVISKLLEYCCCNFRNPSPVRKAVLGITESEERIVSRLYVSADCLVFFYVFKLVNVKNTHK